MDSTARKFLRAAKQRHAAAQFLLRSNYSLDSIYLAGYAVECASKALLIERTPEGMRPGLMASPLFRSRRGHNLADLAAQLRAIGVVMPRKVAPGYARTTWSPTFDMKLGWPRQGMPSDFYRP